MVKVIIYKVYLSIGTLENYSHSYYTEKSKNVKPYTIIIPKNQKSVRFFFFFFIYAAKINIKPTSYWRKISNNSFFKVEVAK